MSDLNDDIEKYLKGELTPKERHALERKALSDPFLADALEGGMNVNEFGDDVRELNKKIHHPRKTFTPIRIAAGIVLLIGASLFYYFNSGSEKPQIAENKLADTLEIAVPQQAQETPQQERSARVISKTLPAPVVTSLLGHDTTNVVHVEALPPVAAAVPSHVVSGTVTTSEDKLPLPGVTVVIKGTTLGTTTDINGRYSLDVADTATLLFSFVGMKTSEIATNDRSAADVSMSEDISQLSEVVISRTALPDEDVEEPVIRLAEPQGGVHEYNKYLENNRRYPQKALDNDVKGKVIVGFDVGLNGELSNFTVIRSLGFGCDEEVMRLVKEGAKWNPTTEDSRPVESTVHVKVKFDAAKYKKRKK